MAETKKADILGVYVDDITMAAAVDEIFDGKTRGKRISVFTPNAEMIMEARKDPEFLQILNKGSFVVPDGAGVLLGAKILGENIREKVAGVELVENILAEGTPLSIYVFGGKPGIAEKAARKIESLYSHITVCGTDHGYHSQDESATVLNNIISAAPDLLLVGLGVPRQEKWIASNIGSFESIICIGCGGTIDVFSGEVKRAPRFFIKMNLEWLYRLMKQPSRLGRMMRIPRFLSLCIKKRLFGTSKRSS